MVTNSPLIILGMHRSGTSLLANWLKSTGLSIGNRLMDKADSNVNGHFEDLDFVDFHEKVFTRNKVFYGGLEKLPPFNLTQEESKKLQSLILSKSAESSNWGFKDPRTCLFLNAYYKIVPDAKYIIAFRPANYVVDSLLRRQKNETKKFFTSGNLKKKIVYKLKSKIINQEIEAKFKIAYTEAWICYNEEILNLVKHLTDKQFKVINMPQFNDKQIFNWLTNTANFDLTYSSYKKVFNATLINSSPPSIQLPKHLLDKVAEIETQFSNLAR